MSNNKQTMKLYTEEQVLKMLQVCRDSDLYEHILTFEDILKTETPIELPSQDEIEEEILLNEYVDNDCDFRQGAEFVINKIQGGNK